MNTLIERIKHLRNLLGKSQEEFANDLNLKRNSITQIETGRRNPSERTLLDICRIYHINENWLSTGEGDIFTNQPITENPTSLDDLAKEKNATPLQIEIVKSFLQLPENTRDELLKAFKPIFKDYSPSAENSQSRNQKPNTDYETANELSPLNEENRKRIIAYTRELEDEQRGTTSSASTALNVNKAKSLIKKAN